MKEDNYQTCSKCGVFADDGGLREGLFTCHDCLESNESMLKETFESLGGEFKDRLNRISGIVLLYTKEEAINTLSDYVFEDSIFDLNDLKEYLNTLHFPIIAIPVMAYQSKDYDKRYHFKEWLFDSNSNEQEVIKIAQYYGVPMAKNNVVIEFDSKKLLKLVKKKGVLVKKMENGSSILFDRPPNDQYKRSLGAVVVNNFLGNVKSIYVVYEDFDGSIKYYDFPRYMSSIYEK